MVQKIKNLGAISCMIYLLLFVVLAGGCSKKDKYVQTFKKNHMNIFPDRYIGKALENFFVDLK